MQHGEEIEQARLVRWTYLRPVRSVLPELAWLFHPANGGKRSAFVGAQMKALGVKRGVLDLLLPVPAFGRHGLAIEMKTDIGTLPTGPVCWSHLFEYIGL